MAKPKIFSYLHCKGSKETTIFIVFYSMFYSILRLAVNSFKEFGRIYIDENRISASCYLAYTIINWLLWSVLLLMSLLVIGALIKKIRKLLIPFLIWMGVVIIGVPAAEVCVLIAIKNISVAISLTLLTLIFIAFNIYCFISVYLYYEDFYKIKRSSKHHRNKRNKRKIHHPQDSGNIEEITKFTKDDVEDGVQNISPKPSKPNKANDEELEKPKKLRSSRKRKHKSSVQNVRLEESNLKPKRSRKMASSKGISKNKSKKTLPIQPKLNLIPESQANSTSETIPVPTHQEV
ncbi:uncharacterized protein LOC111615888 isoform X2 [Centruroides sculpturatus]|uniref:uncharacterized protein LOC111615888 isoform X2 n=1 Tax=Centruroides sculpturatus TaxID=218467 RepID=UPI000C6E61C1|nr:uncharacterized protein LOC111615888 isoform X2 [Centruroides sculpturatus]